MFINPREDNYLLTPYSVIQKINFSLKVFFIFDKACSHFQISRCAIIVHNIYEYTYTITNNFPNYYPFRGVRI